MTQGTLPLDRPPTTLTSNRPGAHHRSPNRNELAGAMDVVPKVGSQRYRILEALVNAGHRGMTDHELSLLLELPVSSINGRRRILVEPDRYVEDSGRDRMGPYGSKRTVWVATARGRKALRDAESPTTPRSASRFPKDAA